MTASRKLPSFWQETLPAPDTRESNSLRAPSSALIAIFLLVASYLALTCEPFGDLAAWQDENWLGSWIYSNGHIPSWMPGVQQWPQGVDAPLLTEQDENTLDADPVSGVLANDTIIQETKAGTAMSSNGSAMASEVTDHIRGPDFDRFVWHRDLKWDPAKSTGRLIVIGDVHGMINELKMLLQHISFDNTSDTLILVGDLVAKAPAIDDSVGVVSYAREIGAKAVRGNHDQRVINFRLWQEYNGAIFEVSTDSDRPTQGDAIKTPTNSTNWLDAESEPEGLRSSLPRGWKWRSQHFEIARRLNAEDFQWLLKRSLTLHIRALHAYIVHAGMLPAEVPRRLKSVSDGTEERNDLESTSPATFEPTPDSQTRMTADDAVLIKSQNRRPSTLLDMRGVTRSGTRPHADGHKGVPWPLLWDDAMIKCHDVKEECRPLDVAYGHWAKRGLQVGNHTIGLDSGCVYGRRLSALIVSGRHGDEIEYDESLTRTVAQFGGQNATIYGHRCRKAELVD